MKFTYRFYQDMLDALRENGYSITDYCNWKQYERCCILRHDIDYNLSQAVRLAEVEADKYARSTWFVMLTSDFYNVFSKQSAGMLKQIVDMGHKIGLHFDEARYAKSNKHDENDKSEYNQMYLKDLVTHIQEEAEILGRAIGGKVEVVSMHRPSKGVLEADLEIPGMVNSYNRIFFKEFKYISDSRRRWREPVEEIIKGKNCKGFDKTANQAGIAHFDLEEERYQRLHILTHAFWYHKEEKDIHDTVEQYINRANHERYQSMRENITDLSSIMPEQEVLYEKGACL